MGDDHNAEVGYVILTVLALSTVLAIVVGMTFNHKDDHHDRQVLATTRQSRNELECGFGEDLDMEFGVCQPSKRCPLALEDEILDRSHTPCDDFYGLACGNWNLAPDTNSDSGSRSFGSMRNRAKKIVEKLVTQAPPESGIRRFFTSCVDTLVYQKHSQETRAQQRYHLRDMVDQLVTYGDLATVFARLQNRGFPTPWALSIENHPTSARMIPMFRRTGFYGLNRTRDYGEVRQIFEANNALSMARSKTDLFFKSLAKLPPAEQSGATDFLHYLDQQFQQDLVPWAELRDQRLEPGGLFSTEVFLRTLGGAGLHFTDRQLIWVPDRSFFEAFQLDRLTLAEWRIYVEFSILCSMNDFFPRLPSDVYFRHHLPTSDTRMGMVHRRWHRLGQVTREDCILATQRMLPGLVSHAWEQANGLTPEDQTRVTHLVEDVRDSFANMIDRSPWLDTITKRRAVEKVRAIRVRAGHPATKHWPVEPFESQLTADRYARNIDMIRQYRVWKDLELWRDEGTWFDLDEIARFGAPLSTANAFYSPTTNSIVVFSGIMQYPFYASCFDDTSLFAALGVVVGHELAHSMDPMGSQFDRWGAYRHWWKHATHEELIRRLQCMAVQYDAPPDCPVPDYGNKTLGEDIADLVGVRAAYEAWEHRHPGATGVDRQHWFLIYAQTWCAILTPEDACWRALLDPHPIPRMRVTETLRNLPAFREAFHCSDEREMVHSPQCIVYGE